MILMKQFAAKRLPPLPLKRQMASPLFNDALCYTPGIMHVYHSQECTAVAHECGSTTGQHEAVMRQPEHLQHNQPLVMAAGTCIYYMYMYVP